MNVQVTWKGKRGQYRIEVSPAEDGGVTVIATGPAPDFTESGLMVSAPRAHDALSLMLKRLEETDA
jgi:hypothetical protein